MGRYTVISGQNLYDVALHIYGSIEGIADLLLSNPALSMATRLRSGDELDYTDNYLISPEVVAYNRTRGIVPAGGERNVYPKESAHRLVAEIYISAKTTSTSLSLSGQGPLEIDWGDNTPLEQIPLSDQLSLIGHTFDSNICGERKIRLYGDFRLRQVDLTALNPSALFLLCPVYAEELVLRDCRLSLEFLPLVEGLYSLDLSGTKLPQLRPLVECRDLMRLDLSGVDVLRENLDELLIDWVREHYGRRNCRVTLTESPSGEYREPRRDEQHNYVIDSGMEALWLLTHEPAWNEGGPWEFEIEGNIYKYEEYPADHAGHTGGSNP